MDAAKLQAVADRLGCDLPALQAVAEVESSGVTFWDIDGAQVPPVRLEAHWFGKLTDYAYNDNHPQISSTDWNPALAAKTQAGAYAQYDEAAKLNPAAAIEACSWGATQIMGFHYSKLGYATPQAFLQDQQTEEGQLECFARFLEIDGGMKASLQLHAWKDFARRYNGTGQIDYYANKLAQAYYNHGGRE